MEIIAHRGFWKVPEEKNTTLAFERALAEGYGIETDFRDFNGELVISHDIADSNAITADMFLGMYNDFKSQGFLAINIKADGLQTKLKALLEKHAIKNYFVFDMSIPDSLGYIKNNINMFSRQSEYEQQPALYDSVQGIWLDEFNSHWFNKETIMNHLYNNKNVCIVSPELHGRDFQKQWDEYRDIERLVSSKTIMLCTDYPDKARSFFNE